MLLCDIVAKTVSDVGSVGPRRCAGIYSCPCARLQRLTAVDRPSAERGCYGDHAIPIERTNFAIMQLYHSNATVPRICRLPSKLNWEQKQIRRYLLNGLFDWKREHASNYQAPAVTYRFRVEVIFLPSILFSKVEAFEFLLGCKASESFNLYEVINSCRLLATTEAYYKILILKNYSARLCCVPDI